MTDLEFVQECVKGDKLAWDEFTDKYSRLIYYCINNVIKSSPKKISPDLVDDIHHDIFVLLRKDDFSKLRSFQAKNGCTLASWLRMVVVNYTIDYLRRQKELVYLDEENSDGLQPKDIIPDTRKTADEILTSQEDLATLTGCIESLSAQDKFFVKLHFNTMVSLQDMAAILRISRGAVDMRKSAIIERLRECFKEKGFLLRF